jgi:hypothetical protein
MLSRKIAPAALPAAVSVLLLIAGCGTMENGRGWGQDAFSPIDGQRVVRAACDAFFSPQTLVPLAGALALQIDGFDQKISDWASDHTPIFGSRSRAHMMSDYLRDALILEALSMPLMIPSGDTPGEWVPAKLKGYGVELGAIGAVGAVTEGLKVGMHRPRPDGTDDMSFPSGHTSAAFSCATLANRNLDSLDGSDDVRAVLEVANTVLAAGVGWARVEGGKHYPSDVLVGAALGHFLTAFIHDAFMNLPEDSKVDFDFFPIGDGGGVELIFRF